MSLFVGKDNAGTPILHLTTTQNSTSELKAGELSSTVFHSNFNYLLYERFTSVGQTQMGSVRTNYNHIMPISTWISVPTEALNLLINSRYVMFIIADGTIYNYRAGSWRIGDDYLVRAIHRYEWHPDTSSVINANYKLVPSSGYGSLHIWGHYSNIDLIVCNLSIVDQAIKYPAFTSSDLKINSSGVVVKGINLNRLQYLSRNIINSTDSTFNTIYDGAYQLINSVNNTYSGLEIVSSSGIQIKNNGKAVFSTLQGISNATLRATSVTSTGGFSISEGNTYMHLAMSGASAGDLVIFSLYDYDDANYTNYCMIEYVEGRSENLWEIVSSSYTKHIISLYFSGGSIYFRYYYYNNYSGTSTLTIPNGYNMVLFRLN